MGDSDRSPSALRHTCCNRRRRCGARRTWVRLDPDVVRVTTQAADALRALGHEVVEIAAPLDYQQLMSTFGPLFHRWLVHDVDALVASGRVADETTLEPFTLLALDHLRRLTMTDIAAAQITAGEITVRLERELQMFDALLTPTLGRSSIPLREMAGDVTDMDRYIELTDEYFPNSWLFNVTGWPSLSVPFGTSGDASMPMPIGVQLSAPIGSEHVLLDMAEQLLT